MGCGSVKDLGVGNHSVIVPIFICTSLKSKGVRTLFKFPVRCTNLKKRLPHMPVVLPFLSSCRFLYSRKNFL